MRYDVTFLSRQLRCAAWLYVPDDLAKGEKAPAIVMAHGFSCVKEQGLDRFADRFAAAGFVVLLFDYRYFGQSEGEPRGQLFPCAQIEDYRNALTWLTGHSQVDPERIGAWGTSFSGGLVLHLSVFDQRVKAVVAQVPSVLNYENCWAGASGKEEPFARFLLQDRIARYRTGAVGTLKVVAPEGEPSVLSGQESYEALTALGQDAPTWRNGVTVESLEKIREFDPTRYIQFIAPTPLLIVGAEQDSLIPAPLVAEAFERAGEPKELLMLPCRHFDLYGVEPWFSRAADAAVGWFGKHLA
ncbi:MAG: alpha/beta hydrolase [Deltaproteobacteria bacterium]|nr:alpha/beta hydrolase [Deltaproteobacteria bacterium]